VLAHVLGHGHMIDSFKLCFIFFFFVCWLIELTSGQVICADV